MHVVFVTGQLDFGGAERQLSLFARALAAEGDLVAVACMSADTEPYGSRLEASGIAVRAFPRSRGWDLGRVLRLRRWFSERRPDAVCAFGEFAAVYAYLALPSRRRPRFVAMLRRSSLRLGAPRRWLVRRAFAAADGVTANSAAGLRYGELDLGVPPGRALLLPNILAPELAAPTRDRASARSELGLPAAAPLVAYVGRMAPAKDIPTLVATLRRVTAETPASAVVIGAGLDRPPGGAWDLDLGVRWLGPREDATTWIAAADVLLLTSRHEGTPNVVLEAMALGTPVVSTAVGDVPMLLEEEAGRTVPAGDAAGLARHVIQLLGDPLERDRVAAAARARVLQRFGSGTQTAALRSLLEGPRVRR